MKLIAGDIGGTKTILSLVEIEQDLKSFTVLSEGTYSSQQYSDLVPLIQEFLTGKDYPEIASLAIAGPVINNTCRLTNLKWYLDGERLARELNLKKVKLLNDFAAVSYGILALKETEIYELQKGEAKSNQPIAVIGAGTGLGESFLIPQDNNNYQVFATEGSHADFAPKNELEWHLLKYVKAKYKLERVSVERIVSGLGIVTIYQFLRDIKFADGSEELKEKINQWELGDNPIDPGAIIGESALNKTDKLANKTLEIFLENYGAETGNLALKILPYSGIYLAGGIAAKILPLLKESKFLETFKNKGRMRNLLENIPIKVVLNPQVGLLGSLYSINYLLHFLPKHKGQ
jgi:glucokinase